MQIKINGQYKTLNGFLVDILDESNIEKGIFFGHIQLSEDEANKYGWPADISAQILGKKEDIAYHYLCDATGKVLMDSQISEAFSLDLS